MSNPFESGARKAIPAVLVYVKSADRTLMLHRNASTPGKVDYHSGKWNGLGGKCEADESFLECARRELREESGLDLEASRFQALGFLHFPNFKAQKSEDWLVWVYSAEIPYDQMESTDVTGPEGDLRWIPTKDLTALNLWAGDRLFIPYVTVGRKFTGTIWYEGQGVVKHEIQVL